MTETLKSKTIYGIIWSAADNLSKQGIQFIISIIIARILAPSDYGLIGMLTIFIAIAQTIVDSGFGTALIQKKNPTQVDYSTVFYFNILVGIILYWILFFSAPLIAGFYQQPKLTNLTRFMGLNIVINSFSLVQANIFIKQIDFKITTKIGIASVLFSGLAGIYLAYKGFGVWSLAIQQIIWALINSLLLWIFSRWRPVFMFSLTSLKTMFAFGSRLLASGILNVIFTNIYNLIIGKAFSANQLGIYTQAQKIQNLPSNFINLTVSRVTFPVFASIQDDNYRLKQGYRKTIKSIVFILFPIMMGLGVIAEPLVKILLTEKWLPSVTILQLLCIVGLTYPLSSVNLNILKVKGRSDTFLRLEVVKKLLVILSIALSVPFGLLAVVISQVIISLVGYFLNMYFSGKLIDFSVREQLTDILPCFTLSTCMAIFIYILSMGINISSISKLTVEILAGIAFYVSGSVIFKFREIQETLMIINKIKNKLLN